MSDWHSWGVSASADRVRALVSGLPGDRSCLRILMALQAFIDDSADGLRQKVFTLAGYIATAEAWAAFSKEWEKHLEDCRIKAFKLSDMPSSQPEIIASFYRIIERHDIPASVDCALDISVWQKVVAEIPWPSKADNLRRMMENPYFIVSKMIMRGLFDFAEKMGFNEPIDLIFDDQVGEKGIVLEAWDFFKASMSPDKQKFIGGYPQFQKDEDFKPLQAADLIAGYVRRSIEQGRDSLKGEDILPWKCQKKIGRLVIRFTEDQLRSELRFICGKENFENALAFLKKQSA